jgi:hypothetical protein
MCINVSYPLPSCTDVCSRATIDRLPRAPAPPLLASAQALQTSSAALLPQQLLPQRLLLPPPRNKRLRPLPLHPLRSKRQRPPRNKKLPLQHPPRSRKQHPLHLQRPLLNKRLPLPLQHPPRSRRQHPPAPPAPTMAEMLACASMCGPLVFLLA